MLIGRYESSSVDQGKLLPQEWLENFIATLTINYADQLEKDHCFFDVYGTTFEKEIVVITSYLHQTDHFAAPIAVFISFDIPDDSKGISSALKELVDLTGHIFDDIFKTINWSDYVPNWTPNKFKNHSFYYKITRENISLSLQAEEILKKERPI